MFILQPAASFGDLICSELASQGSGQRQWQVMEFAVAWVNLLGAQRIEEAAKYFLTEGCSIRATVGLDFASTSYEGLLTLLNLENHGNMTTNVFYDENTACTFHPKVFLFSNKEEALLLVGSNNMTSAGFDLNVEAAIGLTEPLENETIQDARRALAGWRDEGSETRSRKLTRELLDQLCERGYVRTEQEMSEHRRNEAGARSAQDKPLFGRSSSPASKRGQGARKSPEGTTGATNGTSDEVLLMRVRPRRDGKQIQISLKIHEGHFLSGVRQVISTDGSVRDVGYNMARGKPNTARFEASEMQGMTNPVVRFRWVLVEREKNQSRKALQFEVFDAYKSIEGAEILRRLEEGVGTPPVTNLGSLSREETVLSKPNRDIAQWYRLDLL
jgi:hypothetical protein